MSESANNQNVVDVLKERGFVHQMTETGLYEDAESSQLVVYCGFDPTAPSLHIGHLQQVLGLAHFQRQGHRVIALVGGGTGLIGDPSGRSQERQLLSKSETADNVAKIQKQLSRFLSFEGSNPAIMEDNVNWLAQWRLVDFLRDIGKYFTINSMMAKDSVRIRLEERDQGISYTEFSYMLCQAADYLYLFENHGCNVQIGGSDQWGNITAGIDLIRKSKGKTAHGVTFPLLTTASGAKFGKSAGNAMWLDPEMSSPYQVYQFWMNTDDRDVINYLKRFTFVELSVISNLEYKLQESPQLREAQKVLASEFVRMAYGESVASSVQAASELLFDRHKSPLSDTLSDAVIDLLSKEVPSHRISRTQLDGQFTLIDALINLKLAESRSNARRLISQNGIYINNNQHKGDDRGLDVSDLVNGRAILVRSGRKYGLLLAE